MTVRIVYRVPTRPSALGEWQVDMAKQINENVGFPITDIRRMLRDERFIVEVETELPSQAVENMLSDIEEKLPSNAYHVETKGV